ncbi:hypothetical protein ACP4QI_012275 [Leclercia sp. TB492]|uniref:hypothetical protein n=1 Tax=Leclercia sp. TB492 TaxID=3412682 RepID=UPI004048A12F
MAAVIPKQSFPVPSDAKGQEFTSAEELLSKLERERSGLYLVGSQGMWHGGIHITDATIPWCALSTDSEAEKEYRCELYKGEQFIRCMADGEIVAWRVCKDYESAAIEWRGENLHLSTSFVLVKHHIQPGDTEESGLTFFTLYMNLAPCVAYKQQGSLSDRKVAGVQRYYTSAEDLQAGRAAGKLAKDTPVTLSDTIVTRSSDRRQFTEVTITSETKNAAGETLAAGTKIWTVSDRGSLKAAASAPVPSWWAKCAPAYTTQSEGMVNCTSRTDWSYYLSREDVLQYKNAGRLTADFPLSYEPGNTAQQVVRPGRNAGDAARTFSLVTLGRDKDKLKKGDRVWVVSDGDSLTAAPAASGSEPFFNDVHVPPAPVPVSAGDSLGHMGFYQLPEENGKRSRYQVHIECLSMDDMETFITNPGKAGDDAPAYLTWQKDAPLSERGDTGITAGSRKTKAPGILTLANVPGADAAGNALAGTQDAAWYQIRPEGGWLPAASVKKVSQYALGELGFVTLNRAPASFELIDGIQQPDNVVKGILEQLYKAAQDETRTTHALNKYNYQRLLELIDSNHDGCYPEQEYLQAVHNASYRDRLYRVIAKHGSEWYYGKDDPLWKTYLGTLTRDAPLWKTYLETFLDKMTWMKKTAEKGVALGAEPWHMHPIVFLEALKEKSKLINVNAFIALYEKEHVTFASGTPVLSQNSKNNLKKILESINNFYPKHLEYKPNLYGISYMLATTRHETYHFPTGEFFSEQPEVGGLSYFNKYDPVLAATQALKNRALVNGNTKEGDGYKYRGRGCVHLTWKNNYQKAKDKFEIDYVSQPDLAGDFKHAVPIMIWGMEDGLFTGKKLSSYINNSGIDYEGARKIINGSDQKVLIASYAMKFQTILEETSSISKGF